MKNGGQKYKSNKCSISPSQFYAIRRNTMHVGNSIGYSMLIDTLFSTATLLGGRCFSTTIIRSTNSPDSSV